MSDSKWDDMFKQYSDYEKEPANDRWGAIASELDKDKKRRFGMWWLFGIGAAATSTAILLMFWPTNPEQTQTTEQFKQTETSSEQIVVDESTQSETALEREPSAQSALPKETSTPSAQPVPSEPKPSRSGSADFDANTSNPSLADPGHALRSASFNENNVTELASADFRNYPYADKTLDASEISMAHKRPKLITEEEKDEEEKIHPNPKTLGFILGIQSSIALSNFSPSASSASASPSVMPNYMNDNLALRRDIESGGYSVSQGIQVGYQFTKYLSIHTGVRLIQTTQILRYSLQETANDPLNAPQDLPEGGKSVSPSYQLPNQQILAGNDYQLNNKYYGREIPLSLQLDVKLNSKFSLMGQVGGSYRWISSGILYFPDIDNVGMLSLNNPTDYPGIRSTWHTHVGVGVSYELNHGFILSAMPHANMALNSNIRFNRFIQQRQQEFGLNISLVRTIRMNQ